MDKTCEPTTQGGNSTITNGDEAELLCCDIPTRAEGTQESECH